MRVNTDELNRQASELRRVSGQLSDLQDSVLRISRSLCRESVGERFLFPLMDAARAIGNRTDDLGKMRRALQQIARSYEMAEMRIVDEAEHASVHHEQTFFSPIRIPQIRILGGPDAYNPHRDRDWLNLDGLEWVLEQWEADSDHGNGESEGGNLADYLISDAHDVLDSILDQAYIARDNRGPEFGGVSEAILEAIRRAGNTGSWTDSVGTGGIPRNARQIIETIGEAVRERFPENPSDIIGTGPIGRQVIDTINGAASVIDWTPWNP